MIEFLADKNLCRRPGMIGSWVVFSLKQMVLEDWCCRLKPLAIDWLMHWIFLFIWHILVAFSGFRNLFFMVKADFHLLPSRADLHLFYNLQLFSQDILGLTAFWILLYLWIMSQSLFRDCYFLVILSPQRIMNVVSDFYRLFLYGFTVNPPFFNLFWLYLLIPRC